MDNQTIVACTVVTAGTTFLADALHGKPTLKPILAGLFLGAGLLGLAMVAPVLAAGIAALATVTALLINGVDIFTLIGKVFG